MMDINKALLEHLKITLAEYEAGGWGSVDTRFRVPASIVKVFRTNLIGLCQLDDNSVLTTDASWYGGQSRNADGIRQIPVQNEKVRFPYYFVLDSAGSPLASASIDKDKFEPVAVNDVLTSAYYDTKYWEERHYERLLSIVKGYEASGAPHGVVATLNNNLTARTTNFKNLIFTVQSDVFDAARCFTEVALTYLTAVFNNHEVLRAFTSPQALAAQIFPEDITKLRHSVFNAIQYAAKNNQFWEKANSSGYNQGNVALTVEPTQWLLTQDMFGKKALNMLDSADFDLYEIVEVKSANPVLNKRQARLEAGVKGQYKDSQVAGLVPLSKLHIELAAGDRLDDVTLLTKRAVETDEFIAAVKGPKGDPGKDSTVPGPPGPKGEPGSVYDDTDLRNLITDQETSDSLARTGLLNEIKAHKKDLGIKQYTPHHNFDIVGLPNRELRDIYQNTLDNWPLVLRRIFNTIDRRADVFTRIWPFNWFGLEFRKDDHTWLANFFKNDITTRTLKLVANDQNNVKIAIQQFGVYMRIFVIVDDVVQDKCIEWNSTSDNFSIENTQGKVVNIARLWVRETFSNSDTYITDVDDNIKSFDEFENKADRSIKKALGLDAGTQPGRKLLVAEFDSANTSWNFLSKDAEMFQAVPIVHSKHLNYDDITFKLKAFKGGYFTLFIKLVSTDNGQFGLQFRDKNVYSRQATFRGNASNLPGITTKGVNVYAMQGFYPINDTRIRIDIANNGSKCDFEITSKQFKRWTNGRWETRNDVFYKIETLTDVVNQNGIGDVLANDSDFTIRIINKNNRTVKLTNDAFIFLRSEVSA